MRHLLTLTLNHDHDVVSARQRAALLASLLGFDASEQTRIATAVSEIVRNAFRYAGGGTVRFAVDAASRPQRLLTTIEDHGPGIADLEDVLAGRYQSPSGMGMGIVGARRLMDRFSLETSSRGTTVVLEKYLSPRAPFLTEPRVEDIATALATRRPRDLVEEVQEQNQALLRALDELTRRQQELVHLNRELEDTNRGVVALYAELDEKADHLRRADELKSRFLSNMTHEFRTPVNSIIGLCNLIADDRQREGRDLEPEVMYIRKAADQLSELVNDLLDLAKVEAGKTVIRAATFDVRKLFGALRGMLRPLLLNQSVALVVDVPGEEILLHTDEGKVSQILRNLLSNALKFTERGEVRLSASVDGDGRTITFEVSDTGIGIAPADQQRIFEEFAQLEHRLQRGAKGTGLGLALSRGLAQLLGGSLSVTSTLGVGSTFSLTMPTRYRPAAGPDAEWRPIPGRLPLLVVEDAPDAQYFYEKILKPSDFQVYPARSLAETDRALEVIRPAAIVLDIVLDGEPSWDLLVRLKRDPRLVDVPLVVASALPDREKGLALGADAYLQKPVERRVLVETLAALHARRDPPLRVITIDDEEVARYLVRQCLPAPAFAVQEATGALEGLRLAATTQVDAILLDLAMPDMPGDEVLDRLRRDPRTAAVPVVIVTAMALDARARERLLEQASAIVAKSDVSRDLLPAAVRDAVRAARDRAAGAIGDTARYNHDPR